MSSSEVQAHIEKLGDKAWSVRVAAAEALAELRDARAVEPLCILLKDYEQVVRAAAARALLQIGDVRALEPLCAALKDSDFHVRETAAEALGKIGDVRAFEPLAALFLREEQPVRAAVVKALIQIPDARVIDLLCTGLTDEDQQMRLSVVRALLRATDVRLRARDVLAALKDVRVVEALCTALQDKDPGVAIAAAEVLGWIGDVRAVESLTLAFKERHRMYRSAAAEALWNVGDPAVLPLRILSSTVLTTGQKVDSLQGLTQVSCNCSGPWKGSPTIVVRYPLGSIQAFCEKLCRQAGIEESVKGGAEAVLAELQNRANASVLLRASRRNEPGEAAELLLGTIGQSASTPPGELLRPSDTGAARTPSERAGLLSRILHMRGRKPGRQDEK